VDNASGFMALMQVTARQGDSLALHKEHVDFLRRLFSVWAGLFVVRAGPHSEEDHVTYLEAARRLKGWTQADLSARANVHQPFLSQCERGFGLPGPAQRQRLADLLGVPAEKLVDEVPPDVLSSIATSSAVQS
jgi:hypothetical protein